MSVRDFLSGKVTLYAGDCMDVIKTIPDCSIDSVCTDPPYALVSIVKRFGGANAAPAKGDVYARASSGFMGKQWDTGETAFAVEFWAEVMRVLKPGGHVIAASGTRTYHRLACAIEDAGFEIRDQVQWIYASGFPKSHDVSKGIDKAAGAERQVVSDRFRADTGRNDNYGFGENFAVTAPATDAARQWQGWGTSLKPAHEPWVLARKPLIGTVVANVLEHGTGAINVDGCRVGTEAVQIHGYKGNSFSQSYKAEGTTPELGEYKTVEGRWPANVIHDGSDEVLEAFAAFGEKKGFATQRDLKDTPSGYFGAHKAPGERVGFGDTGTAARFFFSAKADANDRIGSKHPTVKPVDLMQYLVRLVTPKGGTVLDPFAGTGTTGEAAFREGMRAVLIEREPEYQADIARRMDLVLAGPDEKRNAILKAKNKVEDAGPLFGGLEAAE